MTRHYPLTRTALRCAYHRHGAADPERTGNPFLYQWRLR